MNDSLPMLQLLRNTRNCVEHPQKNKQQISVTNFTINSQLKISPPTIEVIHPKSRQPKILISKFMEEVNEQCVGIFELMLVFMCQKHVQPFTGFNVGVMLLEEGQMRENHIKFSYCVEINGQISPIG